MSLKNSDFSISKSDMHQTSRKTRSFGRNIAQSTHLSEAIPHIFLFYFLLSSSKKVIGPDPLSPDSDPTLSGVHYDPWKTYESICRAHISHKNIPFGAFTSQCDQKSYISFFVGWEVNP